jgi:hypothetical protein
MMTNANDVNTWMDEMLRVVSGISVIVEFAVLITLVIGIQQKNTSRFPSIYHKHFDNLFFSTLLAPIALPLVALAAYYLLWFSIPSFVVTVSLYLQIYIVMPAIVLAQAMSCYQCATFLYNSEQYDRSR